MVVEKSGKEAILAFESRNSKQLKRFKCVRLARHSGFQSDLSDGLSSGIVIVFIVAVVGFKAITCWNTGQKVNPVELKLRQVKKGKM